MIAGLAGSLLSISTETANYTLLSAEVSTQVVFYAFIGGSAFFFGPAVAAAALVFLPYQLSNYTHAWPLYQGLFFMVVMLSTPHGIGGLLNPSAGAHRSSNRTKELARLLIGMLIVGVIAVCVEVAIRIGPNAIKAFLTNGHIPLLILLAFIAAAALVLSKRMPAAGRFLASKTTKSSQS
jgi:branched-chain amino acid transport system permease protein